MKKIITIILVVFGVLLITKPYYILDLRRYKEKFLIERNYEQNTDNFKLAKERFEIYPKCRVNYDSNNFIDITKHSEFTSEVEEEDFEYAIRRPYISITDTVSFLSLNNRHYIISGLYYIDSTLSIETLDSTFRFREDWYLSYSGYQKSDLFEQTLKVIELDKGMIESIKHELKKLNCFGYSRSTDYLILDFRTNYIMTDTYSYWFDINENNQFFNDTMLPYGQLDKGVYWFHNERIHVNYRPYLKLRNPKI